MAEMESGRNIIAASIKWHRQKKNMSQVQLAALLGVDRQYVWGLENGKINISVDYLDKIIDCLDCDRAAFLVTKHTNVSDNQLPL